MADSVGLSIHICAASPHTSLAVEACLAFHLREKVSAQPTDEVFFRWRTYIAPIRFLRQPGIETTA